MITAIQCALLITAILMGYVAAFLVAKGQNHSSKHHQDANNATTDLLRTQLIDVTKNIQELNSRIDQNIFDISKIKSRTNKLSLKAGFNE